MSWQVVLKWGQMDEWRAEDREFTGRQLSSDKSHLEELRQMKPRIEETLKDLRMICEDIRQEDIDISQYDDEGQWDDRFTSPLIQTFDKFKKEIMDAYESDLKNTKDFLKRHMTSGGSA